MTVVLILVTAVLLGGVARGWLRTDGWVRTPTLVWDALLLPIAWGLVQGGQPSLGAVIGLVGLVGFGAALAVPGQRRTGSPAA